MTCWGKWNATWHFISMLFCWCFSTVETLLEQLHEAWDVQSCLFMLKLVVQRKEWWSSLVLLSEPEVIAAARVNACVGFIPARFWSGSPRHLYSDLSCHIKDCQNTIYYLNFLENKKILSSVHMRAEPKVSYRNGSVRIRVQLHTPNKYIYIYIYI